MLCEEGGYLAEKVVVLGGECLLEVGDGVAHAGPGNGGEAFLLEHRDQHPAFLEIHFAHRYRELDYFLLLIHQCCVLWGGYIRFLEGTDSLFEELTPTLAFGCFLCGPLKRVVEGFYLTDEC